MFIIYTLPIGYCLLRIASLLIYTRGARGGEQEEQEDDEEEQEEQDEQEAEEEEKEEEGGGYEMSSPKMTSI